MCVDGFLCVSVCVSAWVCCVYVLVCVSVCVCVCVCVCVLVWVLHANFEICHFVNVQKMTKISRCIFHTQIDVLHFSDKTFDVELLHGYHGGVIVNDMEYQGDVVITTIYCSIPDDPQHKISDLLLQLF